MTESTLFTQFIPDSLKRVKETSSTNVQAETAISPKIAPQDDLTLFRAHARELRDLLAKEGNDPTWYCQSFNPYPLAISAEHFQTLKKLQSLLYKALTTIVEKYFADAKLQNWLELPEPVFKSLSKLAGKPLRLGSYRPDFLHTMDNSIAICEINARFPANAYFISHYLNNVIGATGYLTDRQQAGLSPRHCPGGTLPLSTFPLSNFSLRAFHGIDRTVELFSAVFAGRKSIYSLYMREKGWDRHFLEYELAKRGHNLISPASVTALLETLETVSGAKSSQDSPALFLELHQDELTEQGALDFVCSNFDRLACFNDPRTIFIVHDKRMLSILCDREKLGAFMSEEEADFLSRHIVPTWTIKDSRDKVEEAIRNSDQFVLKPNLLGKGEGMLFGSSTTPEQFRGALQEEKNSHFILQTFVPQKKHSIYMEVDNQLVLRPVNIVGTLLCFDDELLGPGIYRASPSDIVNVAGGGAILVPMLVT